MISRYVLLDPGKDLTFSRRSYNVHKTFIESLVMSKERCAFFEKKRKVTFLTDCDAHHRGHGLGDGETVHDSTADNAGENEEINLREWKVITENTETSLAAHLGDGDHGHDQGALGFDDAGSRHEVYL